MSQPKQRSGEEELLAKIRTLPPERAAEVEDFVDFLKAREARTREAKVDELFEMMDQLSAVEPRLTPSDYERGKLRPHPEMIVRLAKALRVSTDEVLGVKPPSQNGAPVSRRVLRRLQAIDGLPKRDQDALFRTIDAFFQARRAS